MLTARRPRLVPLVCLLVILASPPVRAGIKGLLLVPEVVELDSAEMGGLETAVEPAAQRAPHRLGLLADLLAHEVAERAFVEGLVLPRDG